MGKEKILQVNNLHVNFHTYAGEVKAIRDVSFYLEKGETLAIVGESGSGKSVTTRTLMGLSAKNAEIFGDIEFKGRNLNDLKEEDWVHIRGNDISMIFQDPMTSLDPTMRIGLQIAEPIIKHEKVTKKEALKRALDMMEKVGIPNAQEHINDYPHQWSGGMRQRAVIAIALATNPEILIADEPTTALDVTIQKQIMDLLSDIKKEFGTTILLISHDLALISNYADSISVMYSGHIVEEGQNVLSQPIHPYTIALLNSLPTRNPNLKLKTIEGTPPNITEEIFGCKFHPRCDCFKAGICDTKTPLLTERHPEHFCACFVK